MNYGNENWLLYLARPFSLFETSVWYEWYGSKQTTEHLGSNIFEFLYIEEKKGFVRSYTKVEDIKKWRSSFDNLVKNNEEKVLALLKDGLRLNKKASEFAKIGVDSFQDIQGAVNFLIELADKATIMAYLAPLVLEETRIENGDIIQISEELRAVSLYPEFFTNVVKPVRDRILETAGVDLKYSELVTYKELLEKKFSNLENRYEARNNNKLFIFEKNIESEKITWEKDTYKYIDDIEGFSENEEIRGSVAFPGKIKGVVRNMFDYNPDAKFNEGDILVTVNSNPKFMPVIKKAGAILTDEGGITCHAAIIAREMKIPCIIGTKDATRALKDGMEVEVDADNGVVKILEK